MVAACRAGRIKQGGFPLLTPPKTAKYFRKKFGGRIQLQHQARGAPQQCCRRPGTKIIAEIHDDEK